MPRPDPASLLSVLQLDETSFERSPVAVYTANQVSPGKRIALHFSLELESGELIDSCFGKPPANFIVGDGSMLPGFEQTLYGLEAGAETQVLLPPEQAFGLHNADNVQQFPRFRFPADLPLCEGLLIDFVDNAGNTQAGVVRQFSSNMVTIDFNHPLASKSIVFTAKVIHIDSGEHGDGQ